jgi:hypothetical protein
MPPLMLPASLLAEMHVLLLLLLLLLLLRLL